MINQNSDYGLFNPNKNSIECKMSYKDELTEPVDFDSGTIESTLTNEFDFAKNRGEYCPQGICECGNDKSWLKEKVYFRERKK